ncbi:MAG: lysine-sensitive aspartokinase 3, partial [Gemmatimonadetes bacterium]
MLKFGGTSVEDAAAFERVAEIVRAERGAHPVVVVSAMSGVTDALLASVEAASAAELEPHFERHRDVAR